MFIERTQYIIDIWDQNHRLANHLRGNNCGENVHATVCVWVARLRFKYRSKSIRLNRIRPTGTKLNWNFTTQSNRIHFHRKTTSDDSPSANITNYFTHDGCIRTPKPGHILFGRFFVFRSCDCKCAAYE